MKKKIFIIVRTSLVIVLTVKCNALYSVQYVKKNLTDFQKNWETSSYRNNWRRSQFVDFFFEKYTNVMYLLCFLFCSDLYCSRITNKKMILFANNEQTNEQFTDFIFTPNICQVYILNYGSNLLHIFPILFHFYVIDLQFCCSS